MFAVTKLAMIASIALQPVAANAASDEARSISIRSDDINLNTIEGQKILAVRIDRAAREVCDFASDQLGHQVRKIERACRNKAKASAWAMVKSNQRLGLR